MEKKRGKGRPPFEITSEVIEKVEQLASQGLTKDQISDCLGISYDTLNDRTKDNANFFDALKRGKAKGIEMVTNALLDNVKDKNVTAQIFYLKTQAKWREQDAQDHDEAKKQILETVKELVSKCLKEV